MIGLKKRDEGSVNVAREECIDSELETSIVMTYPEFLKETQGTDTKS